MSNSNQPETNSANLYDLLRRLRDHAERNEIFILTEPERVFLGHYLQDPDAGIHFKALRQGGTDKNPVYAQSYAIAGDHEVIFCLLTEACMQNPTFAELVNSAAQFMRSHVPKCPHCREALRQATMTWEFKQHPNTDE